MAVEDRLFKNARLVLADEVVSGALKVDAAGVISDIAVGPSAAPGIDCEGDYLLPGLVELHTDHLERQLMPRPDVWWPAMSALMAHDALLATSGITTVLDAIAIGDVHDKPQRDRMLTQALEAIATAQAAGALRAEHWIHIRCEVAHPNLAELFALHANKPNVRLISLMDHTPGARQYADLERFRAHVEKTSGRSRDEIDAFIVERRTESARHAPAHRQAIAEAARRRGISLASHDDETEAHIAEAVALGVSIAEFPTTLEAARAARRHGLAAIMGAPNVVRGGSHSGNVAAVDLARAGLLDALSSDYMPISLLEAPFRLTVEAGLDLPAAVTLVTRKPAAMAGFADRGTLAPGLRADLVRVRELGQTPVIRGVWRQGKRIA